jgi:hypothetical protein
MSFRTFFKRKKNKKKTKGAEDTKRRFLPTHYY